MKVNARTFSFIIGGAVLIWVVTSCFPLFVVLTPEQVDFAKFAMAGASGMLTGLAISKHSDEDDTAG